MKCLIDNDTICDKDNDYMNSCYPCMPLKCYVKGKLDEREKTINECIKAITDFCGGLPNSNLISALECLKGEKVSMARLVDLKELGVDVDTFEKIYRMGEEDGRADAFEEFVDSYREFNRTSPNEICLKEDIECDGACIDCFAKWVQTKRHTNNN